MCGDIFWLVSSTRNSPDISLGSSVSRRAARTRDSRLFASILSSNGYTNLENAFLVAGATSTTGVAPTASGRIAGYAPPSARYERRSMFSEDVPAHQTSSRSVVSWGRNTVKPVLPVSPSSSISAKDPFPGRTVAIIVSPFRSTRRARLGALSHRKVRTLSMYPHLVFARST